MRVRMANYPRCHRLDCFGNKDSKCMILIENLEPGCPFYKHRLQAEKERKEIKLKLLRRYRVVHG